MLATGANSYIARLLGSREKEKANRVLSTAFFLAAAFGLIILGLGTVFIDSMVRLLGATDSCETYSVQYATYVLLVAPFMATSFVMNQCLRAEGSAMLSMIGMGFGGVLNCFLDPLFIFGFGLGVTGSFDGDGNLQAGQLRYSDLPLPDETKPAANLLFPVSTDERDSLPDYQRWISVHVPFGAGRGVRNCAE